jgi:hypothetical protein
LCFWMDKKRTLVFVVDKNQQRTTDLTMMAFFSNTCCFYNACYYYYLASLQIFWKVHKRIVYAGVSLAETVGAGAGAAYSPGESSGAWPWSADKPHSLTSSCNCNSHFSF